MKYLYLTTLLYIFIIPTQAADSSSPTHLKSFFTTPELRKKLDTLRNSGHFDSASSSASPQSNQVNLQGVVLNKNTKPIAFVNDQITTDKRTATNRNSVRSANKDSLNISLSTGARSLRLKPGQSWNSHNNKTQENYSLPDPHIEPATSSNPLSKLLNSGHNE